MKLYLRGYEYKRDHRDDVEWVLRTFSRLPFGCVRFALGLIGSIESFIEHFLIFVNVFDIQTTKLSYCNGI